MLWKGRLHSRGNVGAEHHDTGNSWAPGALWEGELRTAVLHGKRRGRGNALQPLHFCSATKAILH